jgi:hypothetical protein
MEKETIHEKYERECEALWLRHVERKIGAREWAEKDRALFGAYAYDCLHTSVPMVPRKTLGLRVTAA